MKIKFQADADFTQTIVSALLRREPAIDFQTADQAQLRGLPDPEVLAAAAREGRILVSHDHHTMPVHYVGESIGGLLGIACAVRWPERFKSLTL